MKDEPAHLIHDDFDGRCEPRNYWRQFLNCSNGRCVSGYGATKEEAEEHARKKREEVEKFMVKPDLERLRILTSKETDMCPNDIRDAVIIMAKILTKS